MNSKVYIKSIKNGLKVGLDSDCSFEELCLEIRKKFTESKDFFKGGKFCISFEGRSLNDTEEKEISKIIEECAEVTILYIIGTDEAMESTFQKALDRPVEGLQTVGGAKVYAGTLKRGDFLKFDSSIVILGDVEPGATVKSSGNVIVMGGLYGTCIIDSESNDKNFVFTNDFAPERLEINGIVYYSKDKPKWVVKPKFAPKVSYIFNHQVVSENISKEALQNLCNMYR